MARSRSRSKKPQTSPLSGSEPEYVPQVWNGDPAVQKSHNCYAYALSQISPEAVAKCRETLGSLSMRSGMGRTQKRCHTPQPGHASGFPRMRTVYNKTCRDIRTRTLSDNMGITMATFAEACPAGSYKISLSTDPQHDYHYHRQDSNGLWSHKPGRDPVTNRDSNGKLIYNPRTASRDNRGKGSNLNYSRFCGYMCVPQGRSLSIATGGRFRSSTRKRKRVN